MKTLTALLAATALMTSLDSAAQTPPCGTTVASSITFNQDLRCPAGVDAIIVGADSVRIDLNGYSIVGPYTLARPTAAAVGIQSYQFENVEVVGPGWITGFRDPIRLQDGNGHLIRDVQIAESGEVRLRNTSGSRVERNRMGWLSLTSDPKESSMENSIVGNELTNKGGIMLQGCGTAHNVVAGNTIEAFFYAMDIREGANANQVIGNKVLGGSIALARAYGNYVSGNYVELEPLWGAAISLNELALALTCPNGVSAHTVGNTIVDNELVSGQVGVSFYGYGGMVSKNLVTGNVMWGQAGSHLYFTTDADNNDARGNRFPTQAPTVTDNGIGNRWP